MSEGPSWFAPNPVVWKDLLAHARSGGAGARLVVPGIALMVPLAITSTRGWIRRLGKNWQRLHRLIYLSALAGVIHYWWLVKSDIRKPLMYGLILAVLLGLRLLRSRRPSTQGGGNRLLTRAAQ